MSARFLADRPAVGTRVRVTERSLQVRGWTGTIARHHPHDSLAVIIELDRTPTHLGGGQLAGSLGPREIVLSPGDYKVIP